MKYIVGKKLKMTQKYNDKGEVIPLTVVVAGPCVVTQLKTEKNDSYNAVQVGFGAKRILNKPLTGHLKGMGNFAVLKEFRDKNENINLGDKIFADTFEAGDIVKVTGTSIGKGFQGVVKRHGFKGMPKSHGTKDQLRMPGSIGATGPAHVFKGTKMGGRTGGDQVTTSGLEIFEIDVDNNLIYIKGAIPGARNGFVTISCQGELKLNTKQEIVKQEPEVKKEDIKQDKQTEEDKEEKQEIEPENKIKTADKDKESEDKKMETDEKEETNNKNNKEENK